ncbi:Rrf2 family transcriptional regulator, nitric oxide-sensitive transcriptional repressor [Actinopolymorpha cephalotaxi]|nr:Rrf2 family transcriptional regulator [Actinopolymorpha cephalotaxi]SFH52790.1 Rrf2 family transcriptional regulator, nitric oxide-sensitive transcriptional repressor [Actinopolymorpha cephalotaxi]
MTASTDLALRVVMRLAVANGDGNGNAGGDAASMPTTREVAAAMAVPYSHAAKVVTRLQHLGIVEARRGRNGGLTLTDAGRSTSVGWLVRELEGVRDVVGCEDDPPCPLRNACRLRSLLRQALEAFYSTLDPVTVEDLVASPTGPVLLGLAARPAAS